MKKLGLGLLLCAGLWAQMPTDSELRAVFPMSQASGLFYRLQFATAPNKNLEVDGAWLSLNGNTRVQAFTGYNENGTVPGTVQEWLVLLTGRWTNGQLAYRIVNRNYNKCLTTIPVGDSLSVRPCSGALDEVWMLRPVAGATNRALRIVSVTTGLALEAASFSDGARVFLTGSSSSARQQFVLVGFNYSGALPPLSINSNNGRNLIIVPRTNYSLKLAHGGVNGGGIVARSSFFECQDVWRFIDYWTYNSPAPVPGSGMGVLGMVGLAGSNPRSCFALSQAAEIGLSVLGLPGVQASTWSWYRGVNQGWQAIPSTEPGWAYIVNAASGLALQTSGADGAPVIQTNFTGAQNQRFQFQIFNPLY